MAGAHEADLADGVGLKVLAETLVEGKERWLHGLHEEPVVPLCDGKDLLELALVERGRFFAQHVLMAGKGAHAKFGVAVGMGGYVNGVDAGGEEIIERGEGFRDVESLCEGICFFRIAPPDSGEVRACDGAETVSEAGGGAAGANDAEANFLLGFGRVCGGHGFNVARGTVVGRA